MISAGEFALLVWGSLAVVVLVFGYELAVLAAEAGWLDGDDTADDPG